MRVRFTSLAARDYLAREAGTASASLTPGRTAVDIVSDGVDGVPAFAAPVRLRFSAEHGRDYLGAERAAAMLTAGAVPAAVFPGAMAHQEYALLLAAGLLPAADRLVEDLLDRHGVSPLVLASRAAAAGAVGEQTIVALGRAVLDRHEGASVPLSFDWRRACLAELAPAYGEHLLRWLSTTFSRSGRGEADLRWLERAKLAALVAVWWPEEATALLLAGWFRWEQHWLIEDGIAASAIHDPERAITSRQMMVSTGGSFG
jgi:hypothetical protein